MYIKSIHQFLNPDEVKRAKDLYFTIGNMGQYAHTIKDEIIAPNIERINKSLGQKNDPMYLAYLVEYVLGIQKQ